VCIPLFMLSDEEFAKNGEYCRITTRAIGGGTAREIGALKPLSWPRPNPRKRSPCWINQENFNAEYTGDAEGEEFTARRMPSFKCGTLKFSSNPTGSLASFR